MNKMTKGSLIGAAGLALLTGSFGTYALWTDNDQSASGGVTAGELDIVAGSAVWDDLSTGALGDWTPATDLVVPGDTITMVQNFTLTATGKNLDAELVFAPGAITSGDPSKLTVSAVVTAPSGMTVDGGNSNRWTFTDFVGTKTVTATVTYAFDSSATADST
ncbi:MAG: alternate-type signal peptide domain-containing protein, partial [Nocardioidaceae bacterium]